MGLRSSSFSSLYRSRRAVLFALCPFAPPRAVLQQASDERGPAGLVAGPQAPSAVAVKILVEEYKATPVRVVGKALVCAMPGRSAVLVLVEQPPHPDGQLAGDFLQVHEVARAHRALHPQ